MRQNQLGRAYYGNRRPDSFRSPRAIREGDLATYQTVAAGTLKVKVLSFPEPDLWFSPEQMVTVKVTGKNYYAFPQGHTMDVSPLWLEYRPRKGKA